MHGQLRLVSGRVLGRVVDVAEDARAAFAREVPGLVPAQLHVGQFGGGRFGHQRRPRALAGQVEGVDTLGAHRVLAVPGQARAVGREHDSADSLHLRGQRRPGALRGIPGVQAHGRGVGRRGKEAARTRRPGEIADRGREVAGDGLHLARGAVHEEKLAVVVVRDALVRQVAADAVERRRTCPQHQRAGARAVARAHAARHRHHLHGRQRAEVELVQFILVERELRIVAHRAREQQSAAVGTCVLDLARPAAGGQAARDRVGHGDQVQRAHAARAGPAVGQPAQALEALGILAALLVQRVDDGPAAGQPAVPAEMLHVAQQRARRAARQVLEPQRRLAVALRDIAAALAGGAPGERTGVIAADRAHQDAVGRTPDLDPRLARFAGHLGPSQRDRDQFAAGRQLDAGHGLRVQVVADADRVLRRGVRTERRDTGRVARLHRGAQRPGGL
ncbi:MAG: hypothetical protein IPH48_01020 [bacterium]|nr:hypothetical protein [bacterium]